MALKYNGRLDNFKLLISEIEETIPKAIVRYRVPYKNGAIVEDTGLRERSIRLRTYWIKENYEQHKAFLDHLEEQGPYALTHPKYGLMRGCIEQVTIHHNRLKKTADIDITFIEDNFRGISEPRKYTDAEWGTEAAWMDGQDELADEITNDMAYEVGPYASDISSQTLDPTKPTFFEQFSGLSSKAQGYVKSVDKYVRTLQAQCNAVANPANSLIASTIYVQNLPGLVCQTLAQTIERYAILASTLVSFPTRFVSTFTQGVSDIISASQAGVFGKYTRVAVAQQCAVSVGSYLKADELTAQAQRQAALVPVFDVLGQARADTTPPDRILTVTDIEHVLGDTRALLQASVSEARSVQSLKTQAAVLMEYAARVKTGRGALITASIGMPLPLHLICLQYGLPYNDAIQMLAANSAIRNPSFVTGEVTVYGR